MASWLKAAEDLFEVVDRRAKLVVAEISDEQTDFQPPGSQVKKASSRTKGQKRVSKKGSSKRNNAVQEQTSTVVSQSDEAPDKDGATLSIESEGSPSAKPVVEKNNEQHHDFERDDVRSASSELPTDYTVKGDSDQAEISASASSTEAPMSTKRGDLSENASDVHVEHLSLPLPPKQIEVISDNYSKDAVQNNTSEIEDVTPRVEEEGSKSITTDSPSQNEFQLGGGDVKVESPVPQKTLLNEVKLRDSDVKGEIPAPQKPLPNEVQLRDGDVKVESLASQKKQLETKAETPMRVQDQLDEAQGLLKTTNSAGQSKEARLARICAGLSSRLQEYKSENAQLEELLIAERELSKSYEVHIKQLQQELSASKSEVTRVESNMADALAAKNSEIEALLTSMDTLKKQAALSEGNLASLQANMESIMRNRELTETRIMQAIREELASAERRAEEERAAHNATKMSAMEREVELEHRAVEASTALARIQRIVDERTSKATELEQKVALLEVECASLNQELQDMEARVRRGQKKSPEEANQMIQMQAWQEEVERARQGQRDAESKLSSLEAEMQKMRVAMAAMKRDAEHYSRQEHMELEKRYRELTDLLYYKQTQLETMATEKAAAEFQLEKEIKRLQEVQVEAERSRVTRRASSSWEEDTEMNSLEPLPLHHRHMAAASIQLQKAAKLLDSGAVRATRFLWRYPTARVILLFYLVFVHLFLMYLLHRLQEQADDFSAREVAESMGLSTPKLP